MEVDCENYEKINREKGPKQMQIYKESAVKCL